MKVVIIGGTHGNEKSGVFLIHKYLQDCSNLPQDHEYLFAVGNPLAQKKNLRYLDFDLNRSFRPGLIKESDHEYGRSRELKEQVLDWADGSSFFLIDMHTTTSNMGSALVLSKTDLLSAHVAAVTAKKDTDYRVVFNSTEKGGDAFVESIAPHALLIEVGPVAQNVLSPTGIEKTEKALIDILKTLAELENKDLGPIQIEGYQEGGNFSFPVNESGEISGYLHPDLFGKDFHPIEKGASLFVDSQGQIVKYEDDETICPIFIGEAAYLEKGTAFIISEKKVLNID